MPTIISHAAVPLALGLGLGPGRIPPRLLLAGVLLAMLPDLDVVGFKLGIAYGDAMGHRGFSHALATAGLCAAVFSSAARYLGARPWVCWLFLFVAMASHGLLDTLTNGGHGVALLWPWSDVRWFAPWQLIEVSPIGFANFLSLRGLVVLASELLLVWLPAFVVTLCLCAWLPASTPGRTDQA